MGGDAIDCTKAALNYENGARHLKVVITTDSMQFYCHLSSFYFGCIRCGLESECCVFCVAVFSILHIEVLAHSGNQ